MYNGHGDVTELTDASGNVVARYTYGTFGEAAYVSEAFPGGWSNPYRYDGRDGVMYDAPIGLYWMSVRAYDPTLGRFIARDPLGRAPLFFASQPYAYAGNNPIMNVDPSGEMIQSGNGAQTSAAALNGEIVRTRIYAEHPHAWWHSCGDNPNDQSSVCKAWRRWYAPALNRKHAYAQREEVAGAILASVGAVIQVIGAIYLLLSGNDIMRDVALADLVINGLLRVCNYLCGYLPASWQPTIHTVYAFVDGALALLHSIAAIIGRLGSLALGVIKALIVGAKLSTEEELGAIVLLIQSFTKGAFGDALLAVGYGVEAAGQALLAVASRTNNESVESFCQEFLSSCGPMPQSGYMAY